MKVLLIKDVKGLGKAGEIKEVKDGYGNNFLIGKGYAKAATTEILRKFEADKKKQAELEKYEVASLQKLAEELAKIRVKIVKQTGERGAILGSVTKDDIPTAKNEKNGIEIDKKILETEDINTTGIYDVNVKLKHGISAKFEIEVASV